MGQPCQDEQDTNVVQEQSATDISFGVGTMNPHLKMKLKPREIKQFIEGHPTIMCSG